MAATVRKLQDSDRNDVLEISQHIWEGHDYLSSILDQWLHDPNTHFYGVEVDGRIVAVGNLRLVEDGRTGWMEGLRVHPQYRGKGLANDITRHLVKKAESLGVQRLRYTTSTENKASLRLAKMAGFSRILRMAVSWHAQPKSAPPSGDYPLIQKESPQTTCSLLKTNPKMIPHGILIYEWKALDNTCQNLEEIGKTHAFYLALRKKRVNSVSFAHPRQQPYQATWDFTIYATDSCGFLSQLSHNVALALKNGLSSIACTYEPRFEKILNGVNLKSEEHHGTHLVVLEKQMHSPKRKGRDGMDS